MTIQQLANVINFSWEVERTLGFHIPDPVRFKEFVAKSTNTNLALGLEYLAELIKAIHEIADADIELKADGTHPFLTKIGAFRTPTAAVLGADENIIVPPPSLN
jgi:hypothetical protein